MFMLKHDYSNTNTFKELFGVETNEQVPWQVLASSLGTKPMVISQIMRLYTISSTRVKLRGVLIKPHTRSGNWGRGYL